MQRILPNDLTEVDPHTYYNDKQRQNVQIQDIVKHWKKEDICFIPDKEVPHNMCEILDRVEQKGFQAGYKQGIEQGKEQWIEQERIHSLLSLMSTLHFSPGQAMDALQIPEAEREYYMVRISSK